jgi:hypothetical protein
MSQRVPTPSTFSSGGDHAPKVQRSFASTYEFDEFDCYDEGRGRSVLPFDNRHCGSQSLVSVRLGPIVSLFRTSI